MKEEDRVRLSFSRLQPGLEETNVNAMARSAKCDAATAERVLNQLLDEGKAYRTDGRWYGPIESK
jgi:hypothetical protein